MPSWVSRKSKEGAPDQSFFSCELSCIAADVVVGSCRMRQSGEFELDIPVFVLPSDAACFCFPRPGSLRVLRCSTRPASRSGRVRVFFSIAIACDFLVESPSFRWTCSRELFFSSSCMLHIRQAEFSRLDLKASPGNCCSSVSGTEHTLYYHSGQQRGEQFGYAVSFYPGPYGTNLELVGSPSAARGNRIDAGKVTALISGTGEKLYEHFGENGGDNLGFSLSGDFLPNTGIPDFFAAGAPWNGSGSRHWAGSVELLSSMEGSEIMDMAHQIPETVFAWSVCGMPDLDGDGIADLLVGAPSASPGGKLNAGGIYAVSGGKGKLIYSLEGERAGDDFGYAIACLGDVDGDGVPDFAVGAPFASPCGRNQAGSIYVFSGAAGTLIYKIEGDCANGGLGFSLCPLEDMDGDGIPDFAAGIPDCSPGGKGEAGSVCIFSGRDGKKLLCFEGPVPGEECGISVCGAGDLDNDGTEDLAVGAPSASPGNRRFAGKVYLVSGKDGRILKTLEGEGPWDQFGWSVAGTRHSKRKEIMIGAPGSDRVYTYRPAACKIRCRLELDILLTALRKSNLLVPSAPLTGRPWLPCGTQIPSCR